jgi:hypothetical protein
VYFLIQATQEEISNAYRRSSRLYHPDKHVDPIRKKEAEILFNKIKKAYEGNKRMPFFVSLLLNSGSKFIRSYMLSKRCPKLI